jgi:ketosteroid isomerase-like protein
VKRAILLLAAAPLLAAAAPAWKNQALAAAAPFIDKANDEWTRAIVSGDADVLSAPYAADGIFIGPDGSEIRGKQAVREMYSRPRAGAKVLKASINSKGRVAADPDDVFEWGSAVMSVQLGGTVREASGRYLTVWHRSGKQWVITHNIAF